MRFKGKIARGVLAVVGSAALAVAAGGPLYATTAVHGKNGPNGKHGTTVVDKDGNGPTPVIRIPRIGRVGHHVGGGGDNGGSGGGSGIHHHVGRHGHGAGAGGAGGGARGGAGGR